MDSRRVVDEAEAQAEVVEEAAGEAEVAEVADAAVTRQPAQLCEARLAGRILISLPELCRGQARIPL